MSVGYGMFGGCYRLHVDLRLIVSADHVTLPAVSQRHVRVGYTPDVLTDAGMQTKLRNFLI